MLRDQSKKYLKTGLSQSAMSYQTIGGGRFAFLDSGYNGWPVRQLLSMIFGVHACARSPYTLGRGSLPRRIRKTGRSSQFYVRNNQGQNVPLFFPPPAPARELHTDYGREFHPVASLHEGLREPPQRATDAPVRRQLLPRFAPRLYLPTGACGPVIRCYIHSTPWPNPKFLLLNTLQ